MYDQHQRKTDGKDRMLRFMAGSVHAGGGTQTAAQQRHTEKHLLRHTPKFFSGSVLVRNHKGKGERIDCYEVSNEHTITFREGCFLKRVLLLLLLLSLLTGCAEQVTYETVSDDLQTQPAARMRQVILDMPQEAAAPTLQNDTGGEFYHCDGYNLSLQTFSSGDLEKTLKDLSGQTSETLHPIKTAMEFGSRYDWVWTTVGEGGLELCRGCILDDGNYHYALTVMAPEAESADLQVTWKNLFDTFRLTDSQIDLNNGS